MSTVIVEAGVSGRDEVKISAHLKNDRLEDICIQGTGSLNFLEKLQVINEQIKSQKVSELREPGGNSPEDIIFRELFLKIKGQWKLPYEDEELCHCRVVPTTKVVEAIVYGAHTPQQVSQWTTASTACGSCRPDVESLLGFILAT